MKYSFLRLFVAGVLALFASSSLHAAGASDAVPDPPASTGLRPATASANFVGDKACKMCHADEAKGLGTNPHSKLALEHDGKGVTC